MSQTKSDELKLVTFQTKLKFFRATYQQRQLMRHFVVLLVLLAAAVPLWTNKVTDADSGVSHWELFLDDHIIERNTGFQRVLHHPTPKGVVLKPNQPWET